MENNQEDSISLQLSEVAIEENKNSYAIVRNFNDPLLKYPSQVLISSYILPGAFEALKKIPRDLFCVNVMYELDLTGKTKDKTGDTQLFMTGSIEDKETPLTAVIAELKEEIRMEPINDKCMKKLYVDTTLPKKVFWYGCDVKYLKPASSIVKRAETSGYQKNKVCCILYGTYIEVSEFLKSIPIQKEINEENISGLIGMQISDVCNIYSMIDLSPKNPLTKFYWMNDKTFKKGFTGRYFPPELLGTI